MNETKPDAVTGPLVRGVRPLYAKRDHVAQGEHYTRHVSAMTGEGLHAKSAIAAELAHRDMLIERLRIDALNAEGMAGCMAMFRDDMIAAGVITEATPAMFMTEAILSALQAAGWRPNVRANLETTA